MKIPALRRLRIIAAHPIRQFGKLLCAVNPKSKLRHSLLRGSFPAMDIGVHLQSSAKITLYHKGTAAVIFH